MSKTVTSEGLKHKLPRRVINPSSTSKGNRSIAHFERQNTFRDWKHDQLETNLKKVTNVDLDQEFITPEGNSQISTDWDKSIMDQMKNPCASTEPTRVLASHRTGRYNIIFWSFFSTTQNDDHNEWGSSLLQALGGATR